MLRKAVTASKAATVLKENTKYKSLSNDSNVIQNLSKKLKQIIRIFKKKTESEKSPVIQGPVPQGPMTQVEKGRVNKQSKIYDYIDKLTKFLKGNPIVSIQHAVLEGNVEIILEEAKNINLDIKKLIYPIVLKLIHLYIYLKKNRLN